MGLNKETRLSWAQRDANENSFESFFMDTFE
jgi:hypothetical protein